LSQHPFDLKLKTLSKQRIERLTHNMAMFSGTFDDYFTP